ncbi:hypothetical protein [Methyloversatilis sp.]|uniref:hypothetical protein n=1 Tax=Methyloversatilis sp. TaxID=2569862 RepID=UPI0027339662|nr:hypothetical protein [Methyloversatilis sp.]MDP3457043.1 hypothetical protein [Methyloversatilis sp.]
MAREEPNVTVPIAASSDKSIYREKDFIMTSLQDRFDEQFRGPHYLGTSIHAGWKPVVERALERVREALTPEEMAAFHWVQIKEKFGHLRMYWNSAVVPISLMSEDGVEEIAIDTSFDKGLSDKSPVNEVTSEHEISILTALRQKIDVIVQAAESEARRTCHCCGQPGRLYYGGCWATLCDEHAEERQFPPVYGEWLDARNDQRIGKDQVSDRVMYFRGVALFSWRLSGAGPEDFVPVEDMPDWLTAIARGMDVPVLTFLGKPAYLADDLTRVVTTHAIDLREQTEMKLPEGALVNPEQALRYEIGRAIGERRPDIEYTVEPFDSDVAVAGVRSAEGEFRVFKQKGKTVSEVTYCPEDFLEQRAEALEKAADALRAMLREVTRDES